MERECFLSVLVALLGGTMILACGWWPARDGGDGSARHLERLRWRQISLPLVPALIVVAWLCGWALAEPDPTPEKVSILLILASVPFALLLFGRAAIRAVWSLLRDEGDVVTATVGLLRPWVLFSPYLARALDDQTIEAALAHERAHVRHRDPLRIWLAQLATDLQWPWPQARKRFRLWILALELARDEEARASGVEGSDLAAAILASARLGRQAILPANAALINDPSTLKERISRLLEPLQLDQPQTHTVTWTAAAAIPVLLCSIGFGSIFGERIVGMLLRLSA
jgi:BlaR1 peptidase M56